MNTAVQDNHQVELYSAGVPTFEFMANSSEVEYRTQAGGQGLRILVDGVQVLETSAPSNTGTTQGGASNTITLASGASGTNGAYNSQYVNITSGTGSGESGLIPPRHQKTL